MKFLVKAVVGDLLEAAAGSAERLRYYLLVPGILLALAGVVFILQGEGVVGPTSSFMFQNSSWIYQGFAILVLGLVLVVGGVLKGHRKTGS